MVVATAHVCISFSYTDGQGKQPEVTMPGKTIEELYRTARSGILFAVAVFMIVGFAPGDSVPLSGWIGLFLLALANTVNGTQWRSTSEYKKQVKKL